MPIIYETPREFNTPSPETATPKEPTWGETFSSAFNLESDVVAAADILSNTPFKADPSFDLRKSLQDYDTQNNTGFFDSYSDSFIGTKSKDEMLYTIKKIQQEQKDRDVLDRAGWAGYAASITAGLASPITFIPLVGAGTKSAQIAKMASIGFISGGVSEGLLQSTQETRPVSESIIGIAASTALAGILGGVLRTVSPEARVAFENTLTEVAGDINYRGKLQAGGADIVAMSDAGTIASGAQTLSRVINKTGVMTNPVTQNIDQTDFVSWRSLTQSLADAGLVMERNVDEVATAVGGTLENRIGTYSGILNTGVENFDTAYNKYFFNGAPPKVAPTLRAEIGGQLSSAKLSKREFADEVSKAIWEGYTHNIPEVAEAARQVAKDVFEPILAEAQRVGLLPEDVKVVGDRAYVHRMYNVPAIQRRTAEFVNKLAVNYEAKLRQSFAKDLEKLYAKQAKAGEVVEDIQRPGDEVDKLVQQYRDRLAQVEEELPEDVLVTRDVVAEMRAQARELASQPKTLANEKQRKQLLADARDMEKNLGGKELQDAKVEKANLRRRLRTLTQTRAMMDAKRARKFEQIERLDEQNINALNRVAKKAQTVLRSLDKVTDEKLDSELSKLRNEFERVGQLYDKGQEKLVELGETTPTEVRSAPQFTPLEVTQKDLPESVLREAAKLDSMKRVQPFIDEINNSISQVFDQLPKGMRDSYNKAVKENDTDEMFAFIERFDTWANNKEITPELRSAVENVASWVESGGSNALYRQSEEWYKGNFVNNVKAYDDTPLATLESWLEAAKNAPVGDQWYRDPVDIFALKKQIAHKRTFETANTNVPRAVELQEKRFDKLQAVSSKLENAEEFDRATVRATIQEGLDAVVEKVNEVNNRRAVRMAKLEEEQRALRPEVYAAKLKELSEVSPKLEAEFNQRWSAVGEGVDAATKQGNFRDWAIARAEEVKDKIVGTYLRLPAIDMLATERGPELQRVLDIPSKDIADFLETDIQKIARTYTRTMGPDIELYRKFGSMDWREIIRPAVDELNYKIQQIDGNPDLTPAQKEKQTAKLNADFTLYKKNFEAMIERLRGTRGAPDDPEGFAYRAARTVMNMNVLRHMGMVTIASLPDVAQPVLKYGLTRTFRDGFLPLITNLKAFKMNAREAKLAGAAIDVTSHSRAMALRDVVDDMQRGSKFEKGVEWATNRMGLIAMFDYWTQGMKMFTSSVVNAKIMDSLAVVNGAKGNLTVKEATTYLASLGIDGNVAQNIWKQVSTAEGGGKVDGVWWPNTEAWTDPDAIMAYRQALHREVGRTIIQPGMERPLLSDVNTVGRMLYQFKSFGMASTPKVLLAGLQQRDAAVLTGSLASLTIGALSYFIWATVTGGKAYEDMQNAGIDKWADEAISRSGIIGGLGEVQRVAQNIPLTAPLASFSGTKSTRRPGDNLVEALLGPTFDFGQGVAQVVGGLKEPTQSTLRELRKLVPFQNTLLIREAIDAVEGAIGSNLPERRGQ